jgi:hypothetical protein
MVPITAICFNLIIVRVNWYSSGQDSTTSQGITNNGVPLQSVRWNNGNPETSIVTPLEVVVSKHVDHDVESLNSHAKNGSWEHK